MPDRFVTLDDALALPPDARVLDINLPATSNAAAIAALGFSPGLDLTTKVYVKLASGDTRSAVKIRNESNNYALKIDQTGASGVSDAVNIAANFTGAHTPFSVNSNNTTLSTVKIVNAAAQTGGAVIVGVATDAARTAQVIQADNYGSGASFLATQEPGASGVGLQIQYLDAGAGTTTYSSRGLWIAGHHTGGSLAYIENDKVQVSGNLMQLVQSNASSTADCLVISPFGSGAGLKINTSGASNLIVAGNFSVDSNGGVRSPSIVNNASFTNSRVQLTTTGTLVDRTVADNNPVLRVQNASATSTGDIAQFIKGSGAVAAKITADGDLELTDSARGAILKSPNGTRYRVTVGDDGALTTTAL